MRRNLVANLQLPPVALHAQYTKINYTAHGVKFHCGSVSNGINSDDYATIKYY